MKTPVLFIAFNRPDVTARVFQAIRAGRPEYLFIAADGPRPERPSDVLRCGEVRNIVAAVDWPCTVKTLFHEKNLGMRVAERSAFDWFFGSVPEGIVLEDDTLPSASFFPFCEELLRQYRDEPRVMQICGTNLLETWNSGRCSYFFSRHGATWGWASWQRAWRLYDPEMKAWANPETQEALRAGVDKKEFAYRKEKFDKTYAGYIDTWDYQWSFARMLHGGLSIFPAQNLISNIGFSPEATHTKVQNAATSALDTHDVVFPLRGPGDMRTDEAFDVALFKRLVDASSEPFFKKVWRRVTPRWSV